MGSRSERMKIGPSTYLRLISIARSLIADLEERVCDLTDGDATYYHDDLIKRVEVFMEESDLGGRS